MKHLKILLLLPIFIIVFTSCSKDEGESYYVAVGIINITPDSTIIESDLGPRMLVSNNNIDEDIKDGDRVVAYFTLIEDEEPAGIDYIIDIYYLEEIIVKDIVVYDSTTTDTLGNDELGINGISVVKDFLDVSFSFLGGRSKHYINLARPEGELRTDTIYLELRHEDNNDPGVEFLDAFVSFDLTSLQNEVADSVILRIKAHDYDDDEYEKIVTYKYTRSVD